MDDGLATRQRPFAMSAVFALLSATLIGLATIFLSTSLTTFFEASLLAQSRSDALVVSQGVMKRIYESAFKSQPYSQASLDIHFPSQLTEIQELFNELSPSLGLESMAIMDRDGEVIFCTDANLIGDNIGNYDLLKRALAGEACFDIIQANESPLLKGKEEGEKIQIVLPFGKGTAILYRSPALLRELQAKACGQLWEPVYPSWSDSSLCWQFLYGEPIDDCLPQLKQLKDKMKS